MSLRLLASAGRCAGGRRPQRYARAGAQVRRVSLQTASSSSVSTIQFRFLSSVQSMLNVLYVSQEFLYLSQESEGTLLIHEHVDIGAVESTAASPASVHGGVMEGRLRVLSSHTAERGPKPLQTPLQGQCNRAYSHLTGLGCHVPPIPPLNSNCMTTRDCHSIILIGCHAVTSLLGAAPSPPQAAPACLPASVFSGSFTAAMHQRCKSTSRVVQVTRMGWLTKRALSHR